MLITFHVITAPTRGERLARKLWGRALLACFGDRFRLEVSTLFLWYDNYLLTNEIIIIWIAKYSRYVPFFFVVVVVPNAIITNLFLRNLFKFNHRSVWHIYDRLIDTWKKKKKKFLEISLLVKFVLSYRSKLFNFIISKFQYFSILIYHVVFLNL